MCSIRRVYDKYFDFIVKAKWFIIVFWLIILGLGAGFGFQFLSAVSINVSPPKGTPGYNAKNAFEDLFPNRANPQSYIFYFECNGCDNIRESENNVTYYRANRLIEAASNWKGGFVISNQTWWSYPNTTLYTSIKERFLPPNHPRSMITLITAQASHDTTQLQKFVKHVRGSISDLNLPSNYYIGFLGSNTILVDSVEESSTTVTKIDLVVLPLALLVLVYVVQSWRMVIIPIINVSTCLLSSFAMMYGLTQYTAKAPSFVPSVMEAMVIALSIDYSLFLLTRYRFEIMNNKRRGSSAVREAVFHAGEVVFMSGLTLVSCFLGITGFPTQTVYMVGVGCSLCLTMALVINLTMTPALLLAFPVFFSTFQFLPFCTKKEEFGNDKYGGGQDGDDDAINSGSGYILAPDDEDNPNVPRSDEFDNGMSIFGVDTADEKGERAMKGGEDRPSLTLHQEEENNENMRKSYWYRSTKALIKWPYVYLTILIPLALIAPAALSLFDFNYSVANTQIAPRNSPSIECYKRIESTFPLGLMDPLYVIIDASSLGPNAVKTEAFFNTSAKIAELIIERSEVSSSEITAVSYPNGAYLSWAAASFALSNPSLSGPYPAYFNSSTNEDFSAALITISTPFSPFGDKMKGFTKTVRGVLNDGGLPGEYQYYFAGAAVWMVDVTNLTFELFPYIILATVLAIFFMISFLLMSAFIPIRYALTLVFPLSFIFGVAVLIYQKGVLNGLNWAAVGGVDAMYWLSPIITFPICTGLALDYDIFLMCRVAEYRLEGYTNRASILKAVHETGGIITAAGIIMAIAFGGMLFSTTDTLNQIAWILFSSVLFDTFVVRTVLVPAVLTLAARVNWWPRKVPQGKLMDEFGNEATDESKDQALLSVNGSSPKAAEGDGHWNL
mmetsp:Transcript_3702/g.5735  ORF Transcript_3702/g.5735 Transcript_3702/m.5735 type:complete len:898 (+) Transcript_3702:208-2901(+)